MHALGEGADGDVREGLDHAQPRGLVFPVVVVEVAAAGHDDGAVGGVGGEAGVEAVEVAVAVDEAAGLQGLDPEH